MTHQALPSGTTEADRFARSLALLRGPEIQPADGTLAAADLRVQGAALAAARATLHQAVAQAHPGSATDLLGDLEREYGLGDGSTLSTAERQARLLAKFRARGEGTLPALLRTARTIFEEVVFVGHPYDLVAGTNPAMVFSLAVLASAMSWGAAEQRRALDLALGQQAPAHVAWEVGVGDGPDIDPFRCNDPASLLERDLLAL